MSESRTLTGSVCAYCRSARAVHRDHIVSNADRRRYGIAKNDAKYHVPACLACNVRKLDSRLVPPGYEAIRDELNELMAGTRWRVYTGGPVALGVR